MRLLALLMAAGVLVASAPAKAWREGMPGSEVWPAIPAPGGMAGFLGTWEPVCRNDFWQDHGRMTLHEGGRITYQKKRPYLATRYRVIETTPYYVVLMTRDVSKKYGEILRFVILQVSNGGSPRSANLGWNECSPDEEDLKGFAWTEDDAALARVWANAKSCNPAFKEPYAGSPFFGNRGWSQACDFQRPD